MTSTLCIGLKQIQLFEFLTLKDKLIEDDGVLDFRHWLSSNEHLKRLDISGWTLTDDELMACGTALQENTALCVVTVR